MYVRCASDCSATLELLRASKGDTADIEARDGGENVPLVVITLNRPRSCYLSIPAVLYCGLCRKVQVEAKNVKNDQTILLSIVRHDRPSDIKPIPD